MTQTLSTQSPSTPTTIAQLVKIFMIRTSRIPAVLLFVLIVPLVLLCAIMNSNQGKLQAEVFSQVSFGLLSGISLMIILCITLISLPSLFINAKSTGLLKHLKFSKVSTTSFLLSIYTAGILIVFAAIFLNYCVATMIFKLHFTPEQYVNVLISVIFVYSFYYLVGLLLANQCSSEEQIRSFLTPTYFGSLLASGAFIQFSSISGVLGNILRDYNPFYILMHSLNAEITLSQKLSTLQNFVPVVFIIILALVLRKTLKFN